MAEMVPQAVLDYYKGYDPLWWAKGVDPSSLGAWQTGGNLYTDAQGYQWMPQMEGGENGAETGAMPTLTGYRRSMNPGEAVGVGQTSNMYFDPSGQFSHDYYDADSWLNPFTGVLAVAGLGGLGYMGALGGAGAGANAATTFGIVDEAAGALSAAGYGGGAGAGTAAMGAGAGGYAGPTTFGVVDEAAGALSASGMGGAAAPMSSFGFVDEGAGALSAAGGGGASSPSWLQQLGSGASSLIGGGGNMDWAKLGAAALGAYGGSQGVNNESTTQNRMDPRLDPYLYGDLFPRAQGLLGQQFGQAQAQSGAMNNVGMGLLNTNPNPDLASNPYLTGVANDIQRRTGDLLGQNFNNIRGNSIMSGTLGGSRQGVAEGEAMKGAADSMQGQLSNLFYGAYNQDANRNLQKIGMGAGLLGQSQQQAFGPLGQASDIYRPYTGLNSSMTTGGTQGGGWMGALGGALGGAQWAQNMWGGK